MSKPTVKPTENHLRALDEAKDRRITALEAQVAILEGQVRNSQALAAAKPQPPSEHVVRAFERGARAERARVLEQGRIELLSWPLGTPERRALEALRKALQDERLPLPAYTTGGA